jgi:hypothetical protein
MPLIQVTLAEGRTSEEKRALPRVGRASEIALYRSLGFEAVGRCYMAYLGLRTD